VWVTSSSERALTPSAIALGNFDGLHLGHRQVVQPIVHQTAIVQGRVMPGSGLAEGLAYGNERTPSEVMERVYPTVVTFYPHPQEFFSGQPKKLLTPPSEKVTLLKALGVEQLVLLPFDRELAALSPRDFVEVVLVQQLKAQRISVGADFRFGYKRAGTAEMLHAIAATYNIDVTVVPLFTDHGKRVSSSLIREALSRGDIHTANQFLGRSYRLVGSVVQGQQLGRKLGFPTANLQLSPDKFLPCFGVYAVRVELKKDEEEFISDLPSTDAISSLFGVMNIGCRPTVEGKQPTIEVHLFDWDGDLYGKTLIVHLEHYLRSEQKFPSLDALKSQIQEDCILAQRLLKPNRI
jgi:riboflavin kinase / FMN adenylyltransferase